MRLFWAVIVFSVSVSISTQLVSIIKMLVDERISTQMSISVQAAIMARVISLPPEFFKKFSAGELTTKIQNFNTLCSLLYSGFLVTGVTSVFSLVYITQVFHYARELVVPSLCIIALTLGYSVFNTLLRMNINRRNMKAVEKKNGLTYMLIAGIQKIRLSGSETRAFARWTKQYTEEVRNTYGIPVSIMLSDTVALAITLAGNLAMYYFAMRAKISVADYYAFTAAFAMVSGAFTSLVSIGLQAANIRPVLEQVKPIMEAMPEVSDDKKVVTSVSGGIELNHVSFRYAENMPWVLDDLSLKINPGQYVAIVGKTGCGKSTLLRLLMGFETPQKGAVYYDGKNIQTLDLKSLRKKLGVVMQNGKLFQGDIFSNITISAPWLNLDQAWKAAELADIADDIRAMPMGMHTIISEGSGGISGGQKQRLMIARAIAPNPKILMFDEATSALDNITQKKISQALDGLKCTRIVIAHRLSTIRHCDRIIVLDEGKIVEDGSYEELLARGGMFAELVARQRVEV
ncbi:MAG: ATP-binding cassette domain-containing protein, partial [Oscillospiraceae bacterium]|nr:ATP-binding cassette domain-containing protein [Oscillospiraceae bacterium]